LEEALARLADVTRGWIARPESEAGDG